MEENMTMLRRATTLIASVALSLGLTVTPAVARTVGGAAAIGCAPGESGIVARGGIADSRGVVREKDTGQVVDPMPASAIGRAPADFTATVPVYFHVITDGTLGNVSDRDIAAQIRVLNVTYAGGEGGADTGFSFDLAGVTRTDNAKWFATNSGGAEHEMKQALKQGGDNALNVYSTSGGGYLGWAYLPNITETNQSYLDGIVLNWRSMVHVSTDYLDRYDEGETLTHEAGHWLNLEHTFYQGCNKDGDFIDDTPAEKTPTSGCPEGKDTCTAPGLDPIHNYMDYSYDDCYTEFTPDQVQRMRDAWLLYRAP
jgi:hypothetical protein